MVDVMTSRIAVGDHEIHLNQAGKPGGVTLLFLHGSGPGATGASNWEAVLSDLGENFHCLAPDVIGYGDSSHPEPRPAGLGDFTRLRVETLLGLLDALGIERATVIGNSMGGMWTLGMARQAPERVERIVLMGAGGAPVPFGESLPHLVNFYDDPTVESMAALLNEFVFDPTTFGDDLRQIAADRLPRAIRPEVEKSHRATFNLAVPWDFSTDDLANIAVPTMILHGREDRFVRIESALYYFENIPDARLYGIGRCGHWLQIEHHERFVSALRNFIAGRL
jgi:2-hydroxymuconate-semialdehyde hydrolase